MKNFNDYQFEELGIKTLDNEKVTLISPMNQKELIKFRMQIQEHVITVSAKFKNSSFQKQIDIKYFTPDKKFILNFNKIVKVIVKINSESLDIKMIYLNFQHFQEFELTLTKNNHLKQGFIHLHRGTVYRLSTFLKNENKFYF